MMICVGNSYIGTVAKNHYTADRNEEKNGKTRDIT